MDAAQQVSHIIQGLRGPARDVARQMSIDIIREGGYIGDVYCDPISYLLAQLAANFAPLGEESRMNAIQDLMEFKRERGEQIDALLARFAQLRYQAHHGGIGFSMSWEGCSYMLIKAIGVRREHLVDVLRP